MSIQSSLTFLRTGQRSCLYAQSHNRVDDVVIVLLQGLDGLLAGDGRLLHNELDVLGLEARIIDLLAVILLQLSRGFTRNLDEPILQRFIAADHETLWMFVYQTWAQPIQVGGEGGGLRDGDTPGQKLVRLTSATVRRGGFNHRVAGVDILEREARGAVCAARCLDCGCW